jgi:hypothetical protein
MQKYFDSVADTSGKPVNGAKVQVYNYGTTTASSIFADAAGTVTLVNPVTTDTTGYFEFYAADGHYSLSISGTNIGGKVISDILLEDPTNPNPVSATTITATGTSTLQSVTATSLAISGAATVGAGMAVTGALSATGGINSTTIGATTPSTGAFTTLNVTGSSSVVSPTGSLGYGTGAGGTVTQATSKATAVTLNKPTGQITMTADSLAAGASISFQFNNSLISAVDTLIVNIVWSAVSPPNYIVRAGVGVGAANITLKNDSAGALAEAVQINFAIIKGATA